MANAAPAARPAAIELRGVRVHNLKGVDLDVPLARLTVLCGVSGSGKSSLAFDTLYAEGQRRYIDTFSPYVRQFLDRIPRPDADRIEPIPPAIAIRHTRGELSVKSTVATATEIHDALRLLYARVGRVVCPGCGAVIRRDTPERVAARIADLPDGARFQICFPWRATAGGPPAAQATLPSESSSGPIGDETLAGPHASRPSPRNGAALRSAGFSRVIVAGQTRSIDDLPSVKLDPDKELWVVVDRLVSGRTTPERIHDSVETAFRHGGERCLLLWDARSGPLRRVSSARETDESSSQPPERNHDEAWTIERFSAALRCDRCGIEFAEPESRLFSFNTPLGACSECHGFGRVPAISFEKLVPDPSKSLREGAIVPWTTPAYRHELDELLALADQYGLPVDVPFAELRPEHLALIRDGVPEREFGGLSGFFHWLERHRYEMSARIALNRWRSYEVCPACGGGRLQPLALAVRLVVHDDRPNVAELCRREIGDVRAFFAALREQLAGDERVAARVVLAEIESRLEYLDAVGLGYLTLDRPMRTLSGGEARRVTLTAALGSRLVNTLYVLDEPSAGLHPRDSQRVIDAIRRLRDLGNTVVVVEHEEDFIRAADRVVEIGPGAGAAGGQIVFQGTPEELASGADTVTGQHLSRSRPGLRSGPAPNARPREASGALRLVGAREHNLRNVSVEFPLGVLCVVAGPSGSGKSTLVEQTLYPALCRHLSQPCDVETAGAHERLEGFEAVDQVVLADTSPIGHTSRSNAATYLKAFDDIRRVFAETPDARVRNFTASAFSFNSPGGGRCTKCLGTGTIAIDMQFLADVTMTCPECAGKRYRGDILDVKYRGCSIADVLGMTVAEAFTFFRTRRALLRRLNPLKDVGLDYLPLGQPAATLSGGESQRLKLARLLSAGTRARTLFLIDEPTTGLHPADVERLLVTFDQLLAVGHSLIVIEHNLDVIGRAEHVIVLGSGAGARGGEVVAHGPPAEVWGAVTGATGGPVPVRPAAE